MKGKYEGGSKLKSFRLPLKYFKEANAAIEQLLSKYEKPTVLNIVTTGKVGMNVQNPSEVLKDISQAKDKFDFEFLQTAESVPDGVRLSGKEYYELSMGDQPSEKAKELFLAATPSLEVTGKIDPDYMEKALKMVNMGVSTSAVNNSFPTREESDQNFADFNNEIERELMFADRAKKTIPNEMNDLGRHIDPVFFAMAAKMVANAHVVPDETPVLISKELKARLKELDPNIQLPKEK
jgi:hypothetical protein